jgi:hypothetical protein
MGLLGKEIQLKGLTQRGRNRIREHGDRWMVLADPAVRANVTVDPSGGIDFNDGGGPQLFITPVGGDQNHPASRWILLKNDPNFSYSLVGG